MSLLDSLKRILSGPSRDERRSVASSAPPRPSGPPVDSPAHRLLLSRFLHGNEATSVRGAHWDAALGEPSSRALERLAEIGWLVPARTRTKLLSYRVVDLKPLLKARGLPVSGSKDELADRLMAKDPYGIAREVARLSLLECSDTGRAIAEAFVAEKDAQRRAAVEASLACVRRGDIDGACDIVDAFERSQVFARGVSAGGPGETDALARAGREIAKLTMQARPSILAGISADELRQLRVGAVMMQLWGINDARGLVPDGIAAGTRFDDSTAARMVMFAAIQKRNLAEFRAAGVRKIQISDGGDSSCPACREAASRLYPVDQVPELPLPTCTHTSGCRCVATPRDF